MAPAVDDINLMEQADDAFASGRAEAALQLYLALLADASSHRHFAWYRCAALLGRMGEAAVAAESLDVIADHFAEEGSPLLALAAAKELLALDEVRGAGRVRAIAALYGAGSKRLEQRRRGTPPRPPERLAAGTVAQNAAATELAVLRELACDACAAAVAAARREPRERAGSVPRQQLLSDLAPQDFEAVVPLMELRALPTGAVVIEQDTEGRSLFIVVRGGVEVSQRTPAGEDVLLAHLRAGAFFGEMALLTDSPRVARVECSRPTLLIEIDRTALERLAGRSPQVAAVLANYTRERLLRNLMATSPLFHPLDADRREKLIELFETSLFGAGEVVLGEGEEGEGLHVVLSGAVQVTRQDAGELLTLAELGPGQIFGEISLFQRRPATATVRAARKTVLLRLSRDAFNAHVADFPEVVAHVYKVAVEREQANLQLERSQLVPVDEGLVLV